MAEKIIYYVLPTYTQTPSLNTNFTCDNVNYKGFLFSDSTSETGDLLLVYNHGWLDNKYKYINISNKTSWFIENNCSKPITCFIFRTTKNCTIDNSQSVIDSGESYTSTITLGEGKTWEDLKLVSILMGGIDITSTAWDSVNHNININNVTGNLDMTINVGDVPAGYTEYDWIQSSGTQYIQTGTYNFTEETNFEVTFVMFNPISSSDYGYVFQFINSTSQRISLNTYPATSQGEFYFIGSAYNPYITQNNKITIKLLNASFVTPNGTISINRQGKVANNCNFDCLARNGDGKARMKYYGMKVYEGDTIVRDFRPVVRASDSKPGLYDVITETFYTNSGTGEFTYGND